MRFLFVVLLSIINLNSSFNTQETIWLDDNLLITSQSKAKYYRIAGELDGNISYFYKSRTVFRKVHFENGKLDGRFYEFYKTGELRTVGTYENGLKEGSWKTYYANGKIKQKGRYKRGEKVGIWKTFYKNN